MDTRQQVWITGGSRGLGLAVARQLLQDGFDVVAIARTLQPGLAACMEANPGRMAFAPFDLLNTAGIPALVKQLIAEHGCPFAVVNNAGVISPGLVGMIPDGKVEETFRINVFAPIAICKYVGNAMVMGGVRGRFVNISSTSAIRGYQGTAIYAASKAALLHFSRTFAIEMGNLGITVNTIAPGLMETDMGQAITDKFRNQNIASSPLKRLATVEEVAHGVSYFLSPMASATTGQVLAIDAGATI